MALFALVTWQVAARGPLRSLDERLAGELTASSGFGPTLLPSPAAEFFADLGNMAVALPVLMAVLGWVVWRERRAGAARLWLPPVAAAVAMAAVLALVVPLKALVDRPGPPGPLADGSGFYPSGHAATAAVAYGAAVLLLRPNLRRPNLRRPNLRRPYLLRPYLRRPYLRRPYLRRPAARRALVGAVALLNLAVGTGLVRRGYHWPLDVFGSWCLSGCLLWALWRTLRWRERRTASGASSRTVESPGDGQG
ncbi:MULTISPECIES: phosphatase PAP2 family protein [unclassified Streptomyces]|uniref:phosphatase PAP2 family protein n=1 Tax=unclassified Streptomyces TaxID=2593676 RepID=UPI00336AB6F8